MIYYVPCGLIYIIIGTDHKQTEPELTRYNSLINKVLFNTALYHKINNKPHTLVRKNKSMLIEEVENSPGFYSLSEIYCKVAVSLSTALLRISVFLSLRTFLVLNISRPEIIEITSDRESESPSTRKATFLRIASGGSLALSGTQRISSTL